MPKKKKTVRTNAMRVLDAAKIPYQALFFSPEIHSAVGVAEAVGLPPAQVFKTLVLLPERGKPLLVMTPGDGILDLKKVAHATGHKKVQMAPHKQAEQLTGLKVGGISALALLQKGFAVYIDASAGQWEEIVVSAGQRGVNLRLSTDDLIRITGAQIIDAVHLKA